jgi:hypothetical protein
MAPGVEGYRALHTTLRSHFTQLGLHAFHQQAVIFRDLDRAEATATNLVPQMIKHRQALTNCVEEMSHLPRMQEAFAKTVKAVQESIVACEALRALLPGETETFESHLKAYHQRKLLEKETETFESNLKAYNQRKNLENTKATQEESPTLLNTTVEEVREYGPF